MNYIRKGIKMIRLFRKDKILDYCKIIHILHFSIISKKFSLLTFFVYLQSDNKS